MRGLLASFLSGLLCSVAMIKYPDKSRLRKKEFWLKVAEKMQSSSAGRRGDRRGQPVPWHWPSGSGK